MEFFKKKKALKSLALSKGQATVEYILLLVVVMAIAFAINSRLGPGLTQFSGALLGPEGYYACLTRNGLIPGGTYGGNSSSTCGSSVNMAMEGLEGISSESAFSESGSGFFGGNSSLSSSSAGRNSAGKAGAGADGSGSDSDRNGSGDGRGSSSRHKARSSSSGSGADSLAGGGEAGGAGELSGDRQAAFLASLKKGKKGKKKKRKKKAKKHKARRGGTMAGGFNSKKKKGYERTAERVSVSSEGYLGEWQRTGSEKEENSKVFKSSAIRKKSAASAGQEETKNAGRIENRKPTNKGPEEEANKALNFSGMLKYLIIAIIIILIMILIFSQAMEYQSRE